MEDPGEVARVHLGALARVGLKRPRRVGLKVLEPRMPTLEETRAATREKAVVRLELD